MTQEHPSPHVIIIGIQQVMEEVRKIEQNQRDLISRLDKHMTEMALRVANLEAQDRENRADISALKERTVTRAAMWSGIGVLATVGASMGALIALVK